MNEQSSLLVQLPIAFAFFLEIWKLMRISKFCFNWPPAIHTAQKVVRSSSDPNSPKLDAGDSNSLDSSSKENSRPGPGLSGLVHFGERSIEEKATDEIDAQVMRWLFWIVLPLAIAYAGYSLVYQEFSRSVAEGQFLSPFISFQCVFQPLKLALMDSPYSR
ncbi:unnamed protein product [Protopolystoma xenopodis]|uniref:Uncharacterized protein n=1 Tax=Protopolystoma xenopodis TaxID=117903 RepID=A0A3S5A123_9PLAT|nr:unnamed protein product [Protopolystoma xenopodis]